MAAQIKTNNILLKSQESDGVYTCQEKHGLNMKSLSIQLDYIA